MIVLRILAALWIMTATAYAQVKLVKIGVLTDMSGTLSDASGRGSVWAARKAVEDFNASAQNLKVEIIGSDHQNKPDVGANIARQWFDVEKVDVIVDVPVSSVALAISQIARDKNKVLLVTSAATSDITGKACSPNTIHWIYDTWALANAIGKSVVAAGGDTWFFLTSDYAFGHALERDTSSVVGASGGKVLGSVRHPFAASDYASFLLQAQASKAKVIGLANAGNDTVNSIKQAGEFGITRSGQNLAALLLFLTDVHSLGLKLAAGTRLVAPWYWDMSDDNRKFAEEYSKANDGRYPTMVHAGVYSSVLHYLKAISLVDAADGGSVVAKMKSTATNDRLFGTGTIRADGRKIHDMYLFEVKSEKESKRPWDYYKVLAKLPAEQAFRPLAEGGCPFVK